MRRFEVMEALNLFFFDNGSKRAISMKEEHMSVKEDFERGFYEEEKELLVLIKSVCNGAAVCGDMLKPSVDFLAS